MNEKNKPIVILIIVLIGISLCCCICAIAGSALFITQSGGLINTDVLNLPDAQTQPEPALPPTAADPETNQQMDAIETEVAKLRGLSLDSPLKRDFLTQAQLEVHVTEEFFKDYSPEDATNDVTSLALLGLLPRDFDILDFYKKLYAEQIAGYYDNETKSMYVVADSGFGGMERSTYAHEFTHALQDAAYDFENGLNFSEEACESNSEGCAAIQALIEGDATNTQTAWMNAYATKQDIADLQKFYLGFKSPVMDAAPAYMQEDMTFPYLKGSSFVTAITSRDGADAVNKAFTSQKPVSTEQIMHPSRYPDDQPQAVEIALKAEDLGPEWDEVYRETVGEWYTYLILARPYDSAHQQIDSVASAAAEGWGGDQYLILSNGKESALVVKYQWDTEKDGDEAYKAFLAYTKLRFGSQDSADIACKDGYCSSLMKNPDGSFTWLVSSSREVLSLLQTAEVR